MTTTEVRTATHPLARLTAEEITEVRRVARRRRPGRRAAPGSSTSGSQEPAKDDVLAHRRRATPSDRRFRVLLLDLATGLAATSSSSVTAGAVVSARRAGHRHRRPAAGARRGVRAGRAAAGQPTSGGWRPWPRAAWTSTKVRVAPLSAGVYATSTPTRSGRRVAARAGVPPGATRPTCRGRTRSTGSSPTSTLTNRVVDQVIDAGAVPVPAELGQLRRPAGPRPAAHHPEADRDHPAEGSSLTLEGNLLTWENWSLRVGFDAREGLVLHQIGFDDGAASARSSTAPRSPRWSCPTPTRRRCGPGRTTSTPASTCSAGTPTRWSWAATASARSTYFDAVLADEPGRPARAAQRDLHPRGGLRRPLEALRPVHGMAETRRQRRLVISLLHHGRQLRLRLLLVPLPRRHHRAGEQGDRHRLHLRATGRRAPVRHRDRARPGRAVPPAPVLRAAGHGRRRQRQPGRRGRRRPACRWRRTTRTATPSPARRPRWPRSRRPQRTRTRRSAGSGTWSTRSKHNRARPAGRVRAASRRACRRCWPTPGPRSPGGPRSPPSTCGSRRTTPPSATRPATSSTSTPAGRAAGVRARPTATLDGRTSSLWHTFGLTHFPRPEDWPIMPVDYAGFTLKPVGFFDRNPTLDVPKSASSHCAGEGSHGS